MDFSPFNLVTFNNYKSVAPGKNDSYISILSDALLLLENAINCDARQPPLKLAKFYW